MKKLIKIQIVIAVPLVIAGGFFAYFIFMSVFPNSDTNVEVENKITEEVFYSSLNGTEVSEENQNLLPVAIMIENHIDSRPQAGLTDAKIVYEVLTEASITRFLAIYDLSEDLDEIGPVRSARPYFIDIAGEYGAIYAHSGGSPVSLRRLRSENSVFNLDEFFGYNTGYFYRSNKRYAPHNLYTNSDLLLEAKGHYNLQDKSDFTAWKFKDGKSLDSGSDIEIDYSITSSHQIVWKYLKDDNRYQRWQANSRHVDNEGNIIEVDNIIVQYANTVLLDNVGRKRIDLIGEGKAIVFRDGIAIEGSWKRKNDSNRTVFYDFEGNEIEFNRGKIWVQVVPTGMEIRY